MRTASNSEDTEEEKVKVRIASNSEDIEEEKVTGEDS